MADNAGTKVTMVAYGTKRTSDDVRSSVATGGKPDMALIVVSVENDPSVTSAVHCRNEFDARFNPY
jgi:hypothetical protein